MRTQWKGNFLKRIFSKAWKQVNLFRCLHAYLHILIVEKSISFFAWKTWSFIRCDFVRLNLTQFLLLNRAFKLHWFSHFCNSCAFLFSWCDSVFDHIFSSVSVCSHAELSPSSFNLSALWYESNLFIQLLHWNSKFFAAFWLCSIPYHAPFKWPTVNINQSITNWKKICIFFYKSISCMCIGQPRPGYFCHILVQPLFRIFSLWKSVAINWVTTFRDLRQNKFFFCLHTHTRATPFRISFEKLIFFKVSLDSKL